MEERERGVVAPHQHVLAVVELLAGRRVADRGGTTAEHRPALEHQHPRAVLDQRGGRGQPGAAGANDDDVGRHVRGAGPRRMPVMPKRLRMKMPIAMSARAGFGTRIRDANTS